MLQVVYRFLMDYGSKSSQEAAVFLTLVNKYWIKVQQSFWQHTCSGWKEIFSSLQRSKEKISVSGVFLSKLSDRLPECAQHSSSVKKNHKDTQVQRYSLVWKPSNWGSFWFSCSGFDQWYSVGRLIKGEIQHALLKQRAESFSGYKTGQSFHLADACCLEFRLLVQRTCITHIWLPTWCKLVTYTPGMIRWNVVLLTVHE